MADITMCVNDSCPKRHKCYRNTATPNEYRQSIAVFRYGFDELGQFFCENFYPDERRRINGQAQD